ncbi:BspA family leucine-rich repeat surface protein [Chryseobacterium wangxinyae]|uniref:BspA family leucine-rich repeat surface protein n=1 Tax=Chryseobacterium sp. CY350 TaxID=2997336 RepID=UPI002270C616|nr:BspA family leucine-rich repeat surface protein [Chryseobacterium sp. CY350]MCY0978156.1 BspA family leucine-rich repeat surface protein [Chryseobacterium sp. CY350]WBZ95240.1 BspA family leucine-rich repeat surface protein [Chryseobacterium sp. CY350]
MKKLIFVIILLFSFEVTKAQNEFTTVWQPGIASLVTVNAPFQANSNQIWFPGIGQNYTITWEEVGFPQHNGTMTNVTSTSQVLIDFGNHSEGGGSNTLYRVKVSNGNGVFQQIKFASHQNFNPLIETLVPSLQMFGSADKLLEIEHWGNIAWTSMNAAFASCQRMTLTATDSPNLSNVTNASLMFYLTNSFLGASSMQNWDTSNIQNFSFMFAQHHLGIEYTPTVPGFNPSEISAWDMSSATDLSYMFTGRTYFNQNLNSWDVSSVTDMSWMFAICSAFNQPLNNWNTSSLQVMHDLFFNASSFNQSLSNWNTSSVTNMNRAFAYSTQFNQPLDLWNVSNVTKMTSIFRNATSYNQSLATWNLSSLVDGNSAFGNSAIDCENYSKTISGWADNPNTANNVSFILNSPMQYASNITNKRNILINKGWTISGDTVGSCFLSASHIESAGILTIYPNPAENFIYLKNIKNAESYIITDLSGRLIANDYVTKDYINIQDLIPGNYILQILTKEKIQTFKFIKK